MKVATKKFIQKYLEKWGHFVQARAVFIIIFFVLLTSVALWYTKNNLGVNTDTSEMLSRTLSWRKDNLRFKEKFPDDVKTILVVLEGATPETTQLARDKLWQQIKKYPDLFLEARLGDGGDFFLKNGLLFVSKENLKERSKNWRKLFPLLSGLWNNPDSAHLANSLANASRSLKEPTTEINQLMQQFTKALTSVENKEPYLVSWRNMLGGEAEHPDNGRQLIIVKPALNFESLLPGKSAINKIRELATELDLEDEYHVQIKLTGEVALAYEELQSVSESAGLAAILSIIMVAIVLLVALRSIWFVLASLITLFAGLIFTACFAALSIGYLNLISVAFAVLYIGLGIDFSIHLCLRVREALQQRKSKYKALIETNMDVGGALVLCALTTSIGFYSFIPTNFAGVSELGLISGTGIIISLIVNVTLLPALLTVMPIKLKNHRKKSKIWSSSIFSWPSRHPRAIVWSAIILVLISSPLLRKIQFVADPMKLRAPNTESVETFHDLLKSEHFQALRLTVLAESLDEAKTVKKQLKKLSAVRAVKIITDWVPEEQNEKLAIIRNMRRELQRSINRSQQVPERQLNLVKSLKTLSSRLNKWQDNSPQTKNLQLAIANFTDFYQSQDTEQRKVIEQQLDEALMYTWEHQIKSMQKSMEAREITYDKLPESFIKHWQADDIYRVEIFPLKDISDLTAQKEFVNQVLSVSPRATGLPVIHEKAAKSVVESFGFAFIYAFSLITILLFLLFRHIKNVVLILGPLLMASLLTGVCTVLFNLPFNFANIIALPLLLGIGVDNGIHFVHRYYSNSNSQQNLLASSTGKSVLASTLTTICSFGNLAFSTHIGMSSMGQLLAIGMTLTLLSTFLVLPALLELQPKPSKKHH